jgi:hypothetical protein
MAVTLFVDTKGQVPLESADAVVLRLRLPTTGLFAIFGSLTLQTLTGPLRVDAKLTTLDGATVLDTTSVAAPPGSACLSLLGHVDTAASTANEIVDIRVSTGALTTISGTLFALSVDVVTPAATPAR